MYFHAISNVLINSSIKDDDSVYISHCNFTGSDILIEHKKPTHNSKIELKLNCGGGNNNKVNVRVTDAASVGTFDITVDGVSQMEEFEVNITSIESSKVRLTLRNVQNTPVTVGESYLANTSGLF